MQEPTEQRVKFGAVQKGLQEGFLQKKIKGLDYLICLAL